MIAFEKRFIWPVFSLLVGLVCLTGCGRGKALGEPKAPVVGVSQPLRGETTEHAFFTGQLKEKELVEVRARVTGYLKEIAPEFKEGTEIAVDTPLCLIDPEPFEAQLAKATADLAEAKAMVKQNDAQVVQISVQLDRDRRKLARDRQVALTPGAVTAEQLDNDEAAVKGSESQLEALQATAQASRASVQAAEANVRIATLNRDYTRVKSPLEGRIDKRLVSPGNVVTADSTTIARIYQVDPIYADFEIDERTVLSLRRRPQNDPRTKVPVRIQLEDESGFPHEGELALVGVKVDPNTGTLQARAEFKNPKVEIGGRQQRALQPGMFVRVQIAISAPRNSLLVAEDAIGVDQGQRFLYVVGSDNLPEYRPVNLGPRQAGGLRVVEPLQVVREGNAVRLARQGEAGEESIKADEWIIVDGLQRVLPGKPVEAKQGPMPKLDD